MVLVEVLDGAAEHLGLTTRPVRRPSEVDRGGLEGDLLFVDLVVLQPWWREGEVVGALGLVADWQLAFAGTTGALVPVEVTLNLQDYTDVRMPYLYYDSPVLSAASPATTKSSFSPSVVQPKASPHKLTPIAIKGCGLGGSEGGC